MTTYHPTIATAAGKTAKPAKPYPAFPLFPHASGQWAKKIRGRLHYFGVWADHEAALKKYEEQKDALHAGRTPRPDPAQSTVKDLVNQFLNQKRALVEGGELSPLTFADYRTATDEIIRAFGKTRLLTDVAPEDFAAMRTKMAKKWGPQRLGKAIQFIRCVFKHAWESELLDRPARFGPGFKRPAKKVLRLHRAKHGPNLFTADEVRRMLDAAGPHLKAMLLLGINCGFGNADCGTLPISAIDLDTGILDYPRPKTGIQRRCPLWPETIDAIKASLACRPDPKQEVHAGLVFLTRLGDSWQTGTTDGPLSREVGKLVRKLKINGRHRLGYYSLRHTHRTVADEARDQPAADFIMGHEVPHMSSIYRETISDTRLRAVADHVHAWLFAEPRTAVPADNADQVQ
jgi:integrase